MERWDDELLLEGGNPLPPLRVDSMACGRKGLHPSRGTYDRVEDSELLAGWTVDISSTEKFTHQRTHESQRNLIGSVSNTWKGSTPASTISAFAYTNDAIGRRTGRTDSGTSYGTSPVPNVFGYNERSEVTSATMGSGGGAHGYVYDPIGNRKSWSLNAMHPMYAYTSTALNQYSAIVGPDATVISPQYDYDGNMVAYDGWIYTWDGENRLVKAVQGDVEVHFTYDYMSRRVKKKVEVNSATTVHAALQVPSQGARDPLTPKTIYIFSRIFRACTVPLICLSFRHGLLLNRHP